MADTNPITYSRTYSTSGRWKWAIRGTSIGGEARSFAAATRAAKRAFVRHARTQAELRAIEEVEGW